MLDLVSPESRGLTSVAPKKRTPVTVVNQSKKPIRIIAEKNKSSFFSIFFPLCRVTPVLCYADELLTLLE